jgi:type I site-specific restriction-modification system R (restriction) subunit
VAESTTIKTENKNSVSSQFQPTILLFFQVSKKEKWIYCLTGMLEKKTLIDLIRYFIVEKDFKEKTIKKLQHIINIMR